VGLLLLTSRNDLRNFFDASRSYPSQSLASESISENISQNLSLPGVIKPEKEAILPKAVKAEEIRLDVSENIINIERSNLNSYPTNDGSLPIKNQVTEKSGFLTEGSVKENQNISSQIRKNVETSRGLINRVKLSKEKEEGRREKEEGRTKREEGRGEKEEPRGKKEEGRTKNEEGRSKKEEGTISSNVENSAIADANQLRRELLIEPIVIFNEPPSASPASSAGTPSAYGASSREAFIGGGISIPLEKGRDRVDGSLSAGFGLGDPVKDVGVEVSANISSVSPDDFADSGSLGLKLHRYLGDSTAVAVGWSNALRWGDATGAKNTIYGVVTKAFPLQPNNANNKLPLTVSVGLGSGSFRSKGAIEANENGVNLFGSLGLRVAPQVSLVSSWTGNRLNAGVSFVPFKKTPLVVNAVITDVTSNLTTGRGLSLSAGYSFRF
jgi:hypothetical protein